MMNKEMNKLNSRRDWFAGSAALLGAGAVSSMLLRAQSGGTANDIGILNFALRLENLEAALYRQALATFVPQDFQNSAALQTLGGTKTGANLYTFIGQIAQQEQDHVAALTKTIVGLGGTPQPVECYSFGLTTADRFLQVAQTLENAGVMAYNGAIAQIQSAALQATTATIATVEARHAAYLNLLNLALPFAAPFDGTQTMQQVLATAGQFLAANCAPQSAGVTTAVAGPTKLAVITTNSAMVTLDGSLSTSATGKPLQYQWSQDLGSPLVSIANPSSRQATAILMGGAGVYSISLQVTDSLGNSDEDELKISYRPTL